MKRKTILKNTLAYILMTALMTATYFAIDIVLDWVGILEDVSWTSTLCACVFCTAAVITIDVVNRRKTKKDNSGKIIDGCRKILTMTTLMFAAFVFFEWLINSDFEFDVKRWLPLSLAIAIGNYLYERYKTARIEKDDNVLTVVAECADMPSAEALYNKLASNGINAMIVDRQSPIYINGTTDIQIQVCNKDKRTAKRIINS